jgi:two-component system, NtrC family, sensor histidine kinase KinB
MLRWRLTLGLLATLLILLLVGVYGVWLFHDLGRAVDRVLRNNYDSIKACHLMRVDTARVNTFYTRGDRPAPPFDQPAMLDQAEHEFQDAMRVLERNSRTDQQSALVEQLKHALNEYVQTFRTIFAQFRAGDRSLPQTRSHIPEITLRITNLSEQVLHINEEQMLIANQIADQQARDSIRLLVIAMVSSVIVFVLTYARLGQSIITPIRDLTRSIRYLRSRDFEHTLPVKSEEELGELTAEFNLMAQELRNFYRETDRKLIELNQVIRAMLTTLPFPLFILDEKDQIARTNPAAEKLLSSLDSTGRLPEQIGKHLARASITGPDYRLDDLKEAMLFRIDEQEVYFLPRIFSIILEGDKRAGRALMLVDVTRFRWVDEMKSDLLATLSHEIRTPLTGIRLTLHLLLEKRLGDLSSAQEELVASARDDCERLLGTLSSILNLARMENGKTQLDIRPVEPKLILSSALSHFTEPAEAAGHSLKLEALPLLPNVLADFDRIGLVLSNFLSNALKYGAPNSCIRLGASQSDAGLVRFSVRNSGPALSEEEQARVFDKFYRSNKQRSDGAGLGLSIAKQIVQAHDGRIGVHSDLDGDTEFYFDLPSVGEKHVSDLDQHSAIDAATQLSVRAAR